MPSPIKRFHMNTNTNVFTYSHPYRVTPSSSPMKNEHRELAVRSTYIKTRDFFPTVKRWSLVTSVISIEHSPIENSIRILKDKNDELIEKIEKCEITNTWNSQFTMGLKGVIDAAVNGGVDKYREAFFSSEFDSVAPPEQLKFVPDLKKALLEQVDILQRGLDVHKKIMPENMQKLQQQLEGQFVTLKENIMKLQN